MPHTTSNSAYATAPNYLCIYYVSNKAQNKASETLPSSFH